MLKYMDRKQTQGAVTSMEHCNGMKMKVFYFITVLMPEMSEPRVLDKRDASLYLLPSNPEVHRPVEVVKLQPRR